jgi:diguanylate cyclase (GGDEF)-like protein
MVLPHTPRDRALQIAERIRAAVFATSIPHANSKVCGKVTLSIGVACQIPQPQDAGGAAALVEESDRNLYFAKRRGRNRVEIQRTDDVNL